MSHKAKRKTSPLAQQEYVSRDSHNSSEVHGARLRLIEAAKKVCPAFLNKLAADVFPVYRGLAPEARAWVITEIAAIRAEPENAASRRIHCIEPPPEGVRSLEVALSNWASEFHGSEVKWVMDGALCTLDLWYRAPGLLEKQQWDTFRGADLPVVIPDVAFEFGGPGWDFQLQTWAGYNQALRERFEEQLSEYGRMMCELAQACDLAHTRHSYSPVNFEWFALYHFGGMTSTQIADRLTVAGKNNDESTILKGIKTIEQLIGWPKTKHPSVKQENSPIHQLS